MFIQRIGFFRIISHGVFRAHIHKFLRLIELSALFTETVKTIVRRDLTRMDPTMVAVLHISQIHNVCMNLCALSIINTNTERFFFHFHTQNFTLDHCFFRPVSQFCFCRPDTFPIILHKLIHPVFPCSCHQTIRFLRKITVKSRPDPDDRICQKPNADFCAVCQHRKIIFRLLYGLCL